jgi:hypothetical protein
MSNFYIVHKSDGAPSLAEAAAQLHVPIEQIDAAFGVQPVDPQVGDYTVLLKEQSADWKPSSNGPFSNPGIGPFGPVR